MFTFFGSVSIKLLRCSCNVFYSCLRTFLTNSSGNCLPSSLLFQLNYYVVAATYSILIYVRILQKIEYVHYVSSSLGGNKHIILHQQWWPISINVLHCINCIRCLQSLVTITWQLHELYNHKHTFRSNSRRGCCKRCPKSWCNVDLVQHQCWEIPTAR